ncbi:hypothetical protein EUGRSUZ_J01483 [Eucalyptus grandis]|uniref:Uncharacterized protein n=2 Tax=Eucalyptus grandis TaxID=71139 RepID=A0ACC3J5S2_EUCGR|nr:hypothetical protein EUGRSUZ_J01483 [Eucalyptus grandis]
MKASGMCTLAARIHHLNDCYESPQLQSYFILPVLRRHAVKTRNVGIIVQLPPSAPPSPWTTGLFDCMDDPLIVVVACCFPCVTFGQIAEISPAPDWITHFFCECCALSEGYREPKNRGLDPSIDWQGNAANMQNV